MKKVMTILVAALFVGACHCAKCTKAPNRSNSCVKPVCTCTVKNHKKVCKCKHCKHGNCQKPVAKPAPAPQPAPKPVAQPAPAPAPAPAAVARMTEDKDLHEVAVVTKKADNTAMLSFKEPIKFRTNSDEMDAASLKQIQQTADVLKKYSDTHIRVEGHTDSIGDAAYNKDLSQRRAQAVAVQLIKFGVATDQVTAVGYGEDRPVADNKTREGRAANRRVELEVTNK